MRRGAFLKGVPLNKWEREDDAERAYMHTGGKHSVTESQASHRSLGYIGAQRMKGKGETLVSEAQGLGLCL